MVYVVIVKNSKMSFIDSEHTNETGARIAAARYKKREDVEVSVSQREESPAWYEYQF